MVVWLADAGQGCWSGGVGDAGGMVVVMMVKVVLLLELVLVIDVLIG